MLEIVALVFLTRWYGDLADKKGVPSSPYKWLTVAFWFAGELLGLTAATRFLNISITSFTFAGYLLSILGALIGAALVWLTVSNAQIFNRWFRFVAGLAVIAIFGLQTVLWSDAYGTTVDFVSAFTMITCGLFFIAFSASYQSLGLRRRALFFVLVAASWLLLSVLAIIAGITNQELTIGIPFLLFSAVGSIIGVLWALIDSIRNANVYTLSSRNSIES